MIFGMEAHGTPEPSPGKITLPSVMTYIIEFVKKFQTKIYLKENILLISLFKKST